MKVAASAVSEGLCSNSSSTPEALTSSPSTTSRSLTISRTRSSSTRSAAVAAETSRSRATARWLMTARRGYLESGIPQQLPWGELGVELVFECAGRFTNAADLERHLAAGAGFVILSVPMRDGDVPTLAHGVNTAAGKRIVSCASCTTNAITPVMEILNRRVGVRKATMTTVHAYTAGQTLVDGPLADRAADVRRPRISCLRPPAQRAQRRRRCRSLRAGSMVSPSALRCPSVRSPTSPASWRLPRRSRSSILCSAKKR